MKDTEPDMTPLEGDILPPDDDMHLRRDIIIVGGAHPTAALLALLDSPRGNDIVVIRLESPRMPPEPPDMTMELRRALAPDVQPVWKDYRQHPRSMRKR